MIDVKAKVNFYHDSVGNRSEGEVFQVADNATYSALQKAGYVEKVSAGARGTSGMNATNVEAMNPFAAHNMSAEQVGQAQAAANVQAATAAQAQHEQQLQAASQAAQQAQQAAQSASSASSAQSASHAEQAAQSASQTTATNKTTK